MDKKLIRRIMKEKRLSLDKETFLLYNQRIFQKVISHPQYQSAKMIGIYVSMNDEVQTKEIILEALLTHRICVPRIDNGIMNFYEIDSLDELKEGFFHVEEPTTSNLVLTSDIDLMIVPMLAYDSKKYRVGYGKGFYDRYFQQGFHGYKLGITYSFGEVDCIDINQYDCPLDEIVTE